MASATGADGGKPDSGQPDGASPSDSGAPSVDATIDAAIDSGTDAAVTQRGCSAPTPACYTIYAHSNSTLYYLDQSSNTLVTVGPFQAPTLDGGLGADAIVDLAVTPDDVVWVISTTALYKADATTGHVTRIGNLSPCGTQNVALTADRSGKLYVGDTAGSICSLDPTTTPPTLGAVVPMGGGFALEGANLNLMTGATAALANPIGFGLLFGVAYGGGHVIAFTHDGSGHDITVDMDSGTGTLGNVLTDPDSMLPVAFEGAGVNPLVTR